MFKSNIQQFNDGLNEKLSSNGQGIIQQCIAGPLVQTMVDGLENCCICETCVRYLKLKKMPPMSTLNGLKLTETDKQIQEQQLELTELEGH